MSEKQETVHVVQRYMSGERSYGVKAIKVFDDRKDARAYAKRMNEHSRRYDYSVQSCKKG